MDDSAPGLFPGALSDKGAKKGEYESIMKTDYFEEIRKGKKRSTAYLEYVINSAESNVYLKHDLQNNFQTVYFELARLELFNRGIETGPIHFPHIQRSLHRVNERLDCGDFVIPAFLTILYRYQDSDLLTKEMLHRRSVSNLQS